MFKIKLEMLEDKNAKQIASLVGNLCRSFIFGNKFKYKATNLQHYGKLPKIYIFSNNRPIIILKANIYSNLP